MTNQAANSTAGEPTVAGADTAPSFRRTGSPLEVLLAFFRLGVSCFGGPIAHIGYFREEFVVRRRWLDEQAYVDLVALCQFLPGPASSQTGFSIRLMRAGYLGGLAAWTGFTLPSAIILVLFAYGAGALSGAVGAGLLHGLSSSRWPSLRRLSGAWRARYAPIASERRLRLGRRSSFCSARNLSRRLARSCSAALPAMALSRCSIDCGRSLRPASLARRGAGGSDGLPGAALGLIGIFLHGILILLGTLPFWDSFRRRAQS